MNKKIIYSLVGLALIFFLTSLFIFLKSGSKTNDKKSEPVEQQTDAPVEGPETISVKSFFFAEDSRLMLPVPEEIQLTGIKEQVYRQFVDLLIKGKKNFISPIPEEVTLRTLYLVETQKMLVIDFTEELIHKFPAGTDSELEFIYFFVNNICFNFKEIKQVKFLIGGNEYRTISGHIDIENAFLPDFRYLKLD